MARQTVKQTAGKALAWRWQGGGRLRNLLQLVLTEVLKVVRLL